MTDGILFNNIPGSGLSAPIFTFEVNSGGQYEQIDRFVLMGHVNASAALPLNTPTPVSSQDQADALCGAGSMLREMFRIAAANAPAMPMWLLGVADSGTAPVWTLSVGALPGVGVGVMDFCGERISVTFGAADTPTTIATALAAAINAYYNALTGAQLPVTATSSSAIVTLTSRHKGILMNAVDIYVPTNAEVTSNLFYSSGVMTIVRTVDGAGSPTVATPLAALGDDPADYVISPWTDSTSIAAYTTWSNDTSGRWAWSRQSYGHVWTAMAGNFAALVTEGLSLNDRHQSIIGKIAGVQATGTISFSGVPTANQTITINGTVVTFVTSGATGLQVNIAGTAALMAAALLTFLQGATALADAGLSQMSYAASGSTGITVIADLFGNPGNKIAMSTNATNTTVSALLSGGLEGSPHPSWLWCAAFAARLAPWLSDTTTGNVSRNQTGLVVQGLKPPRDLSLRSQNYVGRNTLINSGISTWKVGADGSVQVDKVVTTYRTGVSGNPDIVFRDVQSMYQVAGALKFMRAQIGSEQANKAISDANPGNLGAISTPADIKASFVNAYQTMVKNGVLRDTDIFAQQIVVNINDQNPARVDVYAPMARVSPLDILASNATIYQAFPLAA